MRLKLVLLTLIAACGQPDEGPPNTPPPPPPPPPPVADTPRFTAETGASPRLRLEGAFDGDALTVQIWADGLGPVFGIAGRLAFDPSHLEVADASLAADLLGGEAQLLRRDDGAVVFGFARKGPSLGDAPLDGSVQLSTVRFTAKKAGDSQLSIARAEVRRAGGGFVPTAFLGASVHTAGGAQ